MGRTPPEVFTSLVSNIEDPALRALFTYPFLNASEVFDELIDAASLRILEEVSALTPSGTDPDRWADARGLPLRCRRVLRFLFEKLADSGVLLEEDHSFVRSGQRPAPLEDLCLELIRAEPGAAVGADIIRLLVENAPGFFRGEFTGEEILFAPNRLPLWFRYFSNENLLYAINNTLGAEILSRALPPQGSEILEVGGGCGSAAETALVKLGSRAARYHFTELVPTFARRGERAARAAASSGTRIEGGRLDMTRPWAGQGVPAGSFDAVYAVNCFHVAPDLDFVLAEARAALRPGGAVVLCEGVRPAARPLYLEFVFNFLESFTSVRTHPLRRPSHGFLSPRAWKASFESAGLSRVELYPDVERMARLYPNFFVGAFVARAA